MPINDKNKSFIRPRLRIYSGKNVAFGPGKAELLTSLEKTGSITAAAIALGMSYMRAWTLIRTVNRSFCEPLVVPKGRGGAYLTATGREVLMLYRQMETKCSSVIKPGWRQLQTKLRTSSRT